MARIATDLEKMDIRYDSENDVVYVSFGPVQEADDLEMLPNGIVVRYKDGKPIELTAVRTKETSTKG